MLTSVVPRIDSTVPGRRLSVGRPSTDTTDIHFGIHDILHVGATWLLLEIDPSPVCTTAESPLLPLQLQGKAW